MAARRSRMTKAKINSYMRNVGRSFGYAMVDAISDMNPTVSALFKSTAEQSKDLYESVKNFDAKSLGFESSDIKGTLGQAVKEIRNNALDDIRTGKWYNKERINQYNTKMAEDMLGVNFDDFGNFDDFDFDDTDLDDQASIMEDSARATAEAMDKVGAKVSGAVSTAAIKSADYIVESNRMNTKALYNLNLTGFGQVNKGVSAINGNLQLLVEMAQPITTHIQNSALFYTQTQEYHSKSLELLKQIAANTSPKSSTPMRSGTSSKGYLDYITPEGIIDFASIIKDGGKKIKENTELITSMLSIVPGGEKAIIKMFSSSPLHFALTAAIGQMFNIKGKNGRTIRDSFQDFNTMLSNFSIGLLGKAKRANFGDFFFSPFLRGIRDFLLPDNRVIKKPDIGKYEKGKVDWDGMSRKALMDVIPTQLSQILSALTGEPERRFNYNTGRWVKVSSIISDRNKTMKNITNSAGGNLFRTISKSVDNSTGMSKAAKENYKNQLNQFLEYAVMSGDDRFLDFLNDDFKWSRIGISDIVGKDLQKRINYMRRSNKGSMQLSEFAGNVYRARSNVNRMNSNGVQGAEAALYDNSTRRPGGRLIDMKDDYGFSQNDYLRNILGHVSYIAKNLKNLVGIPGVGGYQQNGSAIVWESGDFMDQSHTKVEQPNDSTDRIKEEYRHPIINDKNQEAYDKDMQSSLDKAMAKKNGLNYSSDEEKYLKKLRAAQNKNDTAAVEAILNDPKYDSIRDSIARKDEIDKYINKGKSFLSGVYNRFRNSSENGSNIIDKVEEQLQVSADTMTKALDEMSEGLNKFIYDKDFGLYKLMNTMTFGVMDMMKSMIPEPIRKGMAELWRRFKISDFGQATFKSLKNIGLSFFGNGNWIIADKANRNIGQAHQGFRDRTAGPIDTRSYEERMFDNQRDDDWVNPFIQQDEYARGARRVNKTGMVTVSKGEMIIPSDLNPFYKKITNRYDQMKAEQKAHANFWGHYYRGTFSAGASNIESQIADQAMNSQSSGRESESHSSKNDDGIGETEDVPPDQAKGALKTVLGAAGKYLGKKLFNSFAGLLDKTEDDKKKISESLNKMAEEAGINKGAIGAGAFIGAGASLITGTFLGPIAGAGIGAAVGFIAKSKTAQEFLFGKTDENGNYTKGFLPSDISKFLKDHGADVGKGAGAGALIGSFMGSPVLGTILGATAGYVKSSDKAKKFLFGDEEEDGIIPRDIINRAKNIFPGLFGGGMIALLAAPGPLIPKLVLGATIGAVAGNDGNKIKEYFFGKKNENGEIEKEGFFGYANRMLFNPILGIIDKGFNKITKRVTDALGGLGKKLRNFLYEKLKGTVFGDKFLGVANAVKSLPGKALKGVTWLAGAPFRGINNAMERSSLKKGDRFRGADGEYLSAQERLNMANERFIPIGDSDALRVDKAIADIAANGNSEDLAELRQQLEFMYDPTKIHEKKIGKTNEEIASKVLEIMNGSSNVNRDDLLKIQKRMKYGKASEDDIYNLAAASNLSQEDIDELIRLTNLQSENYTNKRNNIDLSEQMAKDLRDKYADNPFIANILSKDNLNMGALTHGMQQIDIDLARMKEKEKSEADEKDSTEYAIKDKIPNLLDKISGFAEVLVRHFIGSDVIDHGLSEDKENRSNLTFSEQIRQQFERKQKLYNPLAKDENGNWQYESEEYDFNKAINGDYDSGINDFVSQLSGGASGIKDDPNVEQDENASNELRQKKKDKLAFLGGIGAIPTLGEGISKIGEIAGNIYDKLFNGDEKKETLFDKLKNMILGEGGLLGGLFNFFTGGSGTGLVAKLLGKTGSFFTSFKTLLPGIIKSGIALWLTKEAFMGKFDQLFHNIDNNYMSEDRKGTDKVDKNGNLVTEEINPETGEREYKNSNGETVDPDEVTTADSDTTQTFSERAVNKTVRNALTGRKSIVSMVGKYVYRSVTTKGFREGVSKVAKAMTTAAAGDMAAMSVLKVDIVNNLQKLPKFISNIPGIGKKLEPVAEKIAGGIGKLCDEFLGAGVKAAKLGKVLKKIGIALTVVAFIADFTTGYQDANVIMGVEQATDVEKIVAGLIKAIQNLIPIVDLIPTATVAKVLIDYVAPVFGIDTSSLKQRQDAAQQELERINAEIEKYGQYTDSEGNVHENIVDTYENWADYQKRGLGNYTWTEKIGNKVKDVWSNITGPKKSTGTEVRNITGGGASGINQFDSKYSKYLVGGKSFAKNGCGPASAVMAAGGNLKDAIRIAQKYQTTGGTDAAYFGEMFARQGLRPHFYSGGSSLIDDIASGKPTVLMGQDARNTSKEYSPFGPNNHYVVANGFDRNGNIVVSDPEQNGLRRYSPNILRNVRVGVSGGATGDDNYQQYYNQAASANIDALINGTSGTDYSSAIENAIAQDNNGTVSNSSSGNYRSFGGVTMNTQTGKATSTKGYGSWTAKSSSSSSISTTANNKGDLGFNPNIQTIAGGYLIKDENGNTVHQDTNQGYHYTDGNDYGEATENVSRIWGYLKSKGLSDFASAGLMGCWESESHNTPDTLEGNYHFKEDSNAAMANNTSMDDYTLRLLSWYDQVGHKHKKSTYGPHNGHYYPGYGLAQWTGTRTKALFDFANNSGRDHRDLLTQLDYFWTEYENRPTLKKELEASQNITDATIAALDRYEMDNGKWHTTKTGQKQLAERLENAKKIYMQMNNLKGIFPEGEGDPGDLNEKELEEQMKEASENNKETSKKKDKISLGGILSVISNAFSSAFNKLFYGGNDEDEEEESTTHISSSDSEYGGSDGTSGTTNINANDPVSYMESKLGKIKYKYGADNVEGGVADCSGTVRWAVNKASGINIGRSTAAMYDNKNLKPIWYGNGATRSTAPDEAKRNDILLFQRKTNNKDRVGHVGIYMGDNKYIHIGHGTGTYIDDLSKQNELLKVSRLIDDNGNEINFTGTSEEGIESTDRLYGISKTGANGMPSDIANKLDTSKNKTISQTGANGMPSNIANKLSGKGSGLLHYGPSKAGNYILKDSTREYYKQNSSSHGKLSSNNSGGFSALPFNNIYDYAKKATDTIRNSTTNSTKFISVGDNVNAIRSDTSDINKNIKVIAEAVAAIGQVLGSSVSSKKKSSEVPNSSGSDEAMMKALSGLTEITESIISV